MYIHGNPKTKAQARAWLAAGAVVTVFDPSLFGVRVPWTGTVTVEGPQAPAAHRWYGTATIQGGQVVKIS